MDVLCGNDTLWDSDKIWNADRPYFSACFRNLVLICVPCLLLWLVTLVYLPLIACREACLTTKPGCLFWAKQVSASIMLVLCMVSVLLAVKRATGTLSSDTPLAELLAPCVRSATVMLVLALVAVERRRGVASSTVLFLYWVVVVVTDIVPVYAFIAEQDTVDRLVKSAVVYLCFTLEILQLVLHSFSDTSVTDNGQNYEPECVASFPSWLTYSWMNRLLSRGYRDELHEDDVFPLNSRDQTLNVGKVLFKNKVHRQSKTMQYPDRDSTADRPRQTKMNGHVKPKRRTERNGVAAADEKTPLLSAQWTRNKNDHDDDDDEDVRCNIDDEDHRSWTFQLPASASSTDEFEATITTYRPKRENGFVNKIREGSREGGQKGDGVSNNGRVQILKGEGRVKGDGSFRSELALGWTLAKTFLWPMVVSNVSKLPHDLLVLANPLLLGELILFCDDVTIPAWRGYVTGAALCMSMLLQAVLFQLTFHLSMTLGIRAKAALTAAIFKKVLTVSSKGRRESREGEIINLISVDTLHITVFLGFLPYAWSGPIQLGLSVYFLYRTIGLAAFTGAGLLLVLLALNSWFMSKLGTLQTSLMEHKDSRLKMVTEILAAIKTVKVYAWERVLGSRVSGAREQELHVLQKVALLDASQTVLWTLAPFAISLLTFTTRVFSDVTVGLTSQEVFVTLSYLNVMRNAVTVAPMIIADIVKAAVSLRRLERFLNHDDLDPNSVIRNPMQEAVVTMQSATCSWEKDSTPCLKELSLQVQEGSLVAVVGPMGSGKSSFLAAILGELHVHSGAVSVNTAVSYVPPTPWLRPGTVRSHIVGHDNGPRHQHVDQARYDTAVAVCCLFSDFAAWPAGDLTEIGEKGCTLSGGQRQRINLARAVYESRDLYLMDDPISAVDNRVGRQIFRDLIGQKGLLRDATRIVTTSTFHWLPDADVIVVMSEGEAVEIGDYHDLVAKGGHFAKLVSSSKDHRTPRTGAFEKSETLQVNSQGPAARTSTKVFETTARSGKQKRLKVKNTDSTGLNDHQEEKKRRGRCLMGTTTSQRQTAGNSRRGCEGQSKTVASSVQDQQFKLLGNLSRVLECADPAGDEITGKVVPDRKRKHPEASCISPSDELICTRHSQNVSTDSSAGTQEEKEALCGDHASVAQNANSLDKKDPLLIWTAECSSVHEGRMAGRPNAVRNPLVLHPSFYKETQEEQDDFHADSHEDSRTEYTNTDVESDHTNLITRPRRALSAMLLNDVHDDEDDDHRDRGRDDDTAYDFGDEDCLNLAKGETFPSPDDRDDASLNSTDSGSGSSQSATLITRSQSPHHSVEGGGALATPQTLTDRESCDDDSDDDYDDDDDNKGSGDKVMSTVKEHSEGSADALGATMTASYRWKEELLTSMSCEPLVRGRQHHTLVDEEHVQSGKVKWEVYAATARALGRFSFAVMATCYILFHVTSVTANYWLSYWTDELHRCNWTSLATYDPDSPSSMTSYPLYGLQGAGNVTSFVLYGPDSQSNITPAAPCDQDTIHTNDFYLAVYGALGAGQCIFVITYALLLAVRRVRASREVHTALLQSVLSSPLTFFHRNPAARVLSRMSRDLEVLDTELWWAMEVVLDSLCHVISTCVVVTVGSPYYLVAIVPVGAAYYFIQRYYIGTSRKLRRLENASRSLVFTQLSQLLEGGVVLRAEGAQATAHAYETSAALVDSNLKYAFACNTAQRWLGIRVATMGVVTVGVATSLGVAFRNTTSGGIIGLAITYSLDVTESLNWLVRMAGDLETNAVSVERILEYSSLPPEVAEKFPIVTPSADWPTAGRIQFVNLSARYWPQHNRVLRAISCDIRPGEKVGIVGRTGAGKTSLWGVLLGLLTSSQGAVLIDDVDTRSVSLQELRSRIAVMPQEPLFLDGPVRLNLDPMGVVSDSQMWAVLEQTRLAGHVRSLAGGLDYHCQPDGQGFSSGQRQLLCLARVLLRRCRVIVLDEATSSVDPETETIICQTIQGACADCTVLVISHRLHTVMHCDRVMVLERGRLAEMDSPSRLLRDPFSAFSKLASSSSMTQ